MDVEFGSGPVQDRHEVITDSVDASTAKIGKAYTIVFQQTFSVCSAVFDGLADG